MILRSRWLAVGLEKVGVAQGHEVVVGGLQGIPDGAAVEFVLLHEQVLGAGGLARPG